MIRPFLALGGISISIALAQSSSPVKAREKDHPSPTRTRRTATWMPPKTPWGEPDLEGIWPINHLIGVPLERPKQYGERLYMTDEEFAKAQKSVEARDNRFQSGPIPEADAAKRTMRQTSLIVDPPDGRLPKYTELGVKLQADMRGSYRPGQTVFDSVEDFSAWDRCITRGLPVSMLPRNYNNGIRIMQSPGYVVIILEMAHEARIVPTNGAPPLNSQIKQWLGESRGHWEGNTLVVETTNFNGLVHLTSAATQQPSTPDMRVVERFTRTAADTIEFRMTIEDPAVLSPGSFTVAYPMYLDNKYEMYEYACHEGNTAVRNYIETSRFERAHPKR